jgi:hypothetical protein
VAKELDERPSIAIIARCAVENIFYYYSRVVPKHYIKIDHNRESIILGIVGVKSPMDVLNTLSPETSYYESQNMQG